MTDEQIVDIVLAHMQGKKIQGICRFKSNVWVDVITEKVAWNFVDNEYRVAPEPPDTAGKLQPREFYAPEFKLMSSEPRNKEFIESYYKSKAILLREVI